MITVHSVEKRKILSHRKNISSNQLFSNLSSKTVTFTKNLIKMRESKFPELPHCGVVISEIDPVMFGVHQGGKLLIQTRTKTKQSSSRLDKELSPMVDIKHDRVYCLDFKHCIYCVIIPTHFMEN